MILAIALVYRHLKNFRTSSNGIRTHDVLRDVGAMLYQLGYEAAQLGTGQFVRLMCSRERNH